MFFKPWPVICRMSGCDRKAVKVITIHRTRYPLCDLHEYRIRSAQLAEVKL